MHEFLVKSYLIPISYCLDEIHTRISNEQHQSNMVYFEIKDHFA